MGKGKLNSIKLIHKTYISLFFSTTLVRTSLLLSGSSHTSSNISRSSLSSLVTAYIF